MHNNSNPIFKGSKLQKFSSLREQRPKADFLSPYSKEVRIDFTYIFTHPYIFMN
jgi:hypothetical protein